MHSIPSIDRSVVGGALVAILFVVCGASAAEAPARKTPPPAGAKGAALDACSFISKAELERLLGWELRDGKPKDVSPGLSQCDFTMPPLAYQTRRFSNPPLPEAAGFSSVVITTFPTTEKTFEESRRTMGTEGVAGVGDAAFVNGPAMIYVRVGSRGFSIRLHVDEPRTDAGRARLGDVLRSLARAGVAKLN